MPKYDENGKVTCLRCGWKWRPRVDNPVACPNPHCQSRDWNIPKEESPVEVVHATVSEHAG